MFLHLKQKNSEGKCKRNNYFFKGEGGQLVMLFLI